jgi:hypothetical protein
MANATRVTLAKSMSNIDGFKRRKRGAFIQPVIGFLDLPNSHPPLLRNGGQLSKMACYLMPQRLVQVNVSETCTIDNVLMALAFSIKKSDTFRQALLSAVDENDVVRNIVDIAESVTHDAAARARFKILANCPALITGNYFRIVKGRVYLSMYDSEQVTISKIFGHMLMTSRTSLCNGPCHDTQYLETPSLILPYDVESKSVIGIQVFLDSVFHDNSFCDTTLCRHVVSPLLSSCDLDSADFYQVEGKLECAGLRRLLGREFKCTPPPFLLISVSDLTPFNAKFPMDEEVTVAEIAYKLAGITYYRPGHYTLRMADMHYNDSKADKLRPFKSSLGVGRPNTYIYIRSS